MANMVKDVAPVVAMNGGDGTHSYYRNSQYQKQIAFTSTEVIAEEIFTKLDLQNLSPDASNPIRIADLGCSTGPNTFFAVQHLIQTIKKKHDHQQSQLKFQVFFSDQTTNDFNTLFRSLPLDREYFAAGVAGSFHGRLFPESSIHLVYCSSALLYLSQVPKLVQEKNKKKIHYPNACAEIVDSYASQFAKDVTDFLSARAKEIVKGGMIVIITPCLTIPFSETAGGFLGTSLEVILNEMVNEGKIKEDQLDSFNEPSYFPSPEEMREIVERNRESFSIERMEITYPMAGLEKQFDIQQMMAITRAIREEIYSKHFGPENMDELFDRLTIKCSEKSDWLAETFSDVTMVLVILKRK